MNKSERGFSLVEVLLVLVAAAAIAGGGLYVWHRSHYKASGPSPVYSANSSRKEISSVSSDSCTQQMTATQNGHPHYGLPSSPGRPPANYPDQALPSTYPKPMTVNYLYSHRSALTGKKILLKGVVFEASGSEASGPQGPSQSASLVLGDNCNPYDSSNLTINYVNAPVTDPVTGKKYAAEGAVTIEVNVTLRQSYGYYTVE